MANAINTDSASGIPSENLPNFRAHLVASIEHMIALLDALDEHCDLEDSDPLELEEDACVAGDDGNPVPGQTDWKVGDPNDAEEDNEDCCSASDDAIEVVGNGYGIQQFGIGTPEDAEDNGDREPDENLCGGSEKWSRPHAGTKKSKEAHRARKMPEPKAPIRILRDGRYIEYQFPNDIDQTADRKAKQEVEQFLEDLVND